MKWILFKKYIFREWGGGLQLQENQHYSHDSPDSPDLHYSPDSPDSLDNMQNTIVKWYVSGIFESEIRTQKKIISFQMQRKVFSCLLLSRRFHLQKSDLFGPRTIKHSGRGAKRNWCNFLLFYSKMHLGAEIKDKVVVQRTCFSKVGFRLPPFLLWNGEKKMLQK